jgi:hypothetical protein
MARPLALALLIALVATGCNDSTISRTLGARCAVTADCAQRCLAPDPETPGGLCTLSCTTDGDCPTAARCANQQGGVCLFGCATDPDCAFLGAGWTCQATDAPGGGKVMVCRGN